MDFSWLAALAGGANGAGAGLSDVIAQRNQDDDDARELQRQQLAQANADRSARIQETLAAMQLLGSGKFQLSAPDGAAAQPSASPSALPAPAAAVAATPGAPPGPRSGGNIGTPTAIPIASPASTPAASVAAPAAGSGAMPVPVAPRVLSGPISGPGITPVAAAVQGSGFTPRLEDLQLIPQDQLDAHALKLADDKAKLDAKYAPWHPHTMQEAITAYTAEHPYRPRGGDALNPITGLVHRATLIKSQLADTQTSERAAQKIIDNGLPRHATASDSAAVRSAHAALDSFRQRADSLRGALDKVGAAMATGGEAPDAPDTPPAPDPATNDYADALDRYKQALARNVDPDVAYAAFQKVIARIAQRHGHTP